MDTGKLNRFITFRSGSKTYNARNEPITVWADSATVHAAVVSESGREFVAAKRRREETTVVFCVRKTNAVNNRMQLKFGNNDYEIVYVDNTTSKREWTYISASEVS